MTVKLLSNMKQSEMKPCPPQLSSAHRLLVSMSLFRKRWTALMLRDTAVRSTLIWPPLTTVQTWPSCWRAYPNLLVMPSGSGWWTPPGVNGSGLWETLRFTLIMIHCIATGHRIRRTVVSITVLIWVRTDCGGMTAVITKSFLSATMVSQSHRKDFLFPENSSQCYRIGLKLIQGVTTSPKFELIDFRPHRSKLMHSFWVNISKIIHK